MVPLFLFSVCLVSAWFALVFFLFVFPLVGCEWFAFVPLFFGFPFVWFPAWFALVLVCLFSVGWVRLACFGSIVFGFPFVWFPAWFALVLVCLFSVGWVRLVCFGSIVFVFRLFGFRLFGFRLVCFGSFLFCFFPLAGCEWFALVPLFLVFRLFGFRLVCFGSCLIVFRWLGAVGLLWFRCFWFSVCWVSAWFALVLFVFFPLAGCGWFALVPLFLVFRLLGFRLVCFGSFCFFSVGWVRLVCFGSIVYVFRLFGVRLVCLGSFLFVFRWLGASGLLWFRFFWFSVCLVSAWFALVLFCLFSVGWVRVVCLVSAWFALVIFVCFPLAGCGLLASVPLFLVFRLFGFRLVSFGVFVCLFFRWLGTSGLLWFRCFRFSVCLVSAWFALVLFCLFSVGWVRFACFGSIVFGFPFVWFPPGLLWFCFVCFPLVGCEWFALVPLFLVFRLFGFRLVCFGSVLFAFRWLSASGLLWFRCFCFPFVWFPLGLLWFCFVCFPLAGCGLLALVPFFPFVWFPLGLLWFFFVCFPFVGCGLLALVPLFVFSVCLVSAWFALVLLCLFSIGWVRVVCFGSVAFGFPFAWFPLGLLLFFFVCFPLAGCGWFALVPLFIVFRLFGVRLACFGSVFCLPLAGYGWFALVPLFLVFRWLGAVGLLWFRCFFCFSVCLVSAWFALVPLCLVFRVFSFCLVCFGSFLFVFRSLGAVCLLWFHCCCFPFVWFPLGWLWFFFECFPLAGCGWFALVPLFLFSVCLVSAWFALVHFFLFSVGWVRLVCFGSIVFGFPFVWFPLGLLWFCFICFQLVGCEWFALVPLFLVFRLFGFRLVCFGSFLFVFRWLGVVCLLWFHCF